MHSDTKVDSISVQKFSVSIKSRQSFFCLASRGSRITFDGVLANPRIQRRRIHQDAQRCGGLYFILYQFNKLHKND